MIFAMTFQKKMAKLLDDHNLSPADLAERLARRGHAISAETIRKYKTVDEKKANPTVKHLLAISKYFCVPLDYLADDDVDALPSDELTDDEDAVSELMKMITPKVARKILYEAVQMRMKGLQDVDRGSARPVVLPEDHVSKSSEIKGVS